MEDFVKVLRSHMKVPPDHYKGPLATSKGHAALFIPVAATGKCKQVNRAIMVTLFMSGIGPICDSK